MFRKLELFPFSGERKEKANVLGALERAKLNYYIHRGYLFLRDPTEYIYMSYW
jgi:hypothetical protein